MNTSTAQTGSIPGDIVVGITGPNREQAALRFAAHHASRTGATAVLVHAFHADPRTPPGIHLTYGGASDIGTWVVKEVTDEFARANPGCEFHGLSVGGPPARVLADLSRDARLVVVQQHGGHGLGRIFTGSTATGVAARAECPVVSVNPDWQSQDATGEVVVGVHEGGGPRDVLEAGFAWASETGAPLRVVHAWRLDGAYDEIITARVDADWRREQKQAIEEAVVGLREQYPHVDVTVEVRHQWASDVLVDDSRVASMVIVGRHHARPWATHHVGSVARAVLREAKSPVMVVPVTERSLTDDWGLTADELSPQI